jgi:hypothetical protein
MDEWKAAQNEKMLHLKTIEEGVAEMNAEIARLRKGIQDYLDGNYASPRDGRKEGPQLTTALLNFTNRVSSQDGVSK